MPLYEYECKQCHEHTEKIQKFSDPEITECPHCGGTLERVVSAAAFSLKGGGWYKDGYGSAKPKASSGESESKPKSGASTNGDSAPKSDSSPSTVSSVDASASLSTVTTPTVAPSASGSSASDKK